MDQHDFTFVDDPHQHSQSSHAHHTDAAHDDAAEAMLASLRAVINDNDHHASGGLLHDDDDDDEEEDGEGDGIGDGEGNTPQPPGSAELVSIPSEGAVDAQTLNVFPPITNLSQPSPLPTAPLSTVDQAPVPVPTATATHDKLLASLNSIIKENQTILDAMNSPGAIHGLAQSLKGLGEGNRKLSELAKSLTGQFKLAEYTAGLQGIESNIDPTLMPSGVVLRSEYDDLKTKYDELLASSSTGTRGKKGRKSKAAKADPAAPTVSEPRQRDESVVPLGGVEGRKKRSIKLEHLVHKMANQRLGVEYPISTFECKGTKDLPEPSSIPPTAETSVNGVDEYRPNFVADLEEETVRPFLDRVVEDVVEAWDAGLGYDEPDVDRERIVGAVNIYWTRLVKRYDEQLHRERGEIHRDELSRRKQNTYRRQQSLLARRLAAFDASPLNQCKLRALYRTLLTIDFAAQTQDSPDPKRAYTAEEWYAYRKAACGSRANEAHEVIDQFWLSANARALLNILDVSSADQVAKSRRKGRPKAPNPTFHLPSELWDRSTLPILRPKDTSGLPIAGAQGLILFRFHVDESVQQLNPDWANGLYDNPPIPEEDTTLPSLPEVMASPEHADLRPMIKAARDAAMPKPLSNAEVEEINLRVNRPDQAIEVDQAILDPALDMQEDGEYMTFAALSSLATATATAAATATNGNVDVDVGAINDNHNHTEAGIVQTDLGHGATSGEVTALAADVDVDVDAEGSPVSVTADALVSASGTPLPTNPASAIWANPYILSSIPLLSASTPTPASSSSPPPSSPAATANANANTNTGDAKAPVSGAGAGGTPAGPSPGSSMRARKLGKRQASELPGGAATPVAKRRKEGGGIGVALVDVVRGEGEVEGDLSGDAKFLQGL